MGRWVMADCVYNTVILPTIPITRYSSPMDPTSVFSSKAEIYARCRWNYAPEAIEAIFQTAGLHSGSVVADIGAGTGILTRHFIGRVAQVYAVEPNDAMAGQARNYLADLSGWTLVSAPAERSTLTGASIDLITAAHALDWLQADAARAEFQRIAKPGGWLAVITNRLTSEPLLKLLPELSAHARQEVNRHHIDHQPPEYYLRSAKILRFSFPFNYQQSWEAFLGGIVSTSDMPDTDHPGYPAMLQTARSIFDRLAEDDALHVTAETHVVMGLLGD
jgi:ubiquinone/menaquinone biosynthesis C-methylase UbiE